MVYNERTQEIKVCDIPLNEFISTGLLDSNWVLVSKKPTLIFDKEKFYNIDKSYFLNFPLEAGDDQFTQINCFQEQILDAIIFWQKNCLRTSKIFQFSLGDGEFDHTTLLKIIRFIYIMDTVMFNPFDERPPNESEILGKYLLIDGGKTPNKIYTKNDISSIYQKNVMGIIILG